MLNLDRPTVTLRTLGENIAEAESKDPEVIRPLENPSQRARRPGCALRQPGALMERVVKVGGRRPGDDEARRPREDL